jgi:CheY-like chemotaxis protein
MSDGRGQGRAALEVLLVEDNPGDIRLTREAFREKGIPATLRVARDGMEALAVLRREGEHRSGRLPDLILLDLNLPKKDGREVLAEIKADPALRHIPVIVLTSSEAEQDIAKAYDLHANCFVTKPADLDQFFHVFDAIGEFWLETVKLPRHAPGG